MEVEQGKERHASHSMCLGWFGVFGSRVGVARLLPVLGLGVGWKRGRGQQRVVRTLVQCSQGAWTVVEEGEATSGRDNSSRRESILPWKRFAMAAAGAEGSAQMDRC